MQKTCLAALALAAGTLALSPALARAQDAAPAPAADAAATPPATTTTTTTDTPAAAAPADATTTTTTDAPAAAPAPAADATTTTTTTTSADAAPAAATAPTPDPAAAEAAASPDSSAPTDGFFKRTLGVKPYVGYNFVLNNISTAGAVPVSTNQKTADPKGRLNIVRLGFQITDNVALEAQGGFAGKRRGRDGANAYSGSGTGTPNPVNALYAKTGGGGYVVFSALAFDVVDLRFPIGYAAYKTDYDGTRPAGALSPNIKGLSYGAELGLPLDKVFTALAPYPSLEFTAGGMFYGRANELQTSTVNGATNSNQVSYRLYGVQFGVKLTFR